MKTIKKTWNVVTVVLLGIFMSKKLLCLTLFAIVAMAAPVKADTLSGLADVNVVDNVIISIQYDGNNYAVADGDLVLGTTTRWYIVDGVEMLWAEGDPAPAATVSGTSSVKSDDVGSNADNFIFGASGNDDGMSSIDGINFQETIFPAPSDTFFLFERGGNDAGTWQAILVDGSLGAEVTFDNASNGGPYADTGVPAFGQNAYGVVFKTDVPVLGVRITASGHDTFSISIPAPEPTLVATVAELEAAAAAANPLDRIILAEGIYAITSQIEIKSLVTYQGAGSGKTIIDCNGLTRAFDGRGDVAQNDDLPYSETGYPANTSGPKDWKIKGLTIINGVADAVSKSIERVGENPDSSPPLTENVFTNAGMTTNGGGIVLENDAQGLLMDVAFENCIALATGVDDEDPNVITYLGQGGAVYMSDATADITDCYFTNNMASNDGGAVYATNAELENLALSIENSTFANNSARDDGGAICSVRRNITVTGCTGDGNHTGLDPNGADASGDADGGFLYAAGADKVSGTSYTDDTPDLEMLAYGGVIKVVDCNIINGSARRGGGLRANSPAQLFVTNSSFANCHGASGEASKDTDGGAINATGISPFNPAANALGDPGVYLDGVTVDGCTAGDDGGGMAIDNWSAGASDNYLLSPTVVINNTTVTNCRAGLANEDKKGDGGGIYFGNKLDINITNTLVDNCQGIHAGAGIMIDGTTTRVVIDRCQISNCSNTADGHGDGDGPALRMDQDDNADVLVTNCIFANNVNRQDDGVVSIDAMLATVANCTFVGNVSMKDKGILYFATSFKGPPLLNRGINNLFVNNDTSGGSDETAGYSSSDNDPYMVFLNNAFFGSVLDGSDKEIKNLDSGEMAATGNFNTTVDPLVDTAGGDYHLAAGSEAIDAGTADDAPDHDFEGNARPQGSAPDVGAYESPAN